MIVHADYTHPTPDQPVLRGITRGTMRLLFRGLIRPGVPVPAQRVILRLLTATMPMAGGVQRSRELIAGRSCEWHRAPNSAGKVILYLHGGAYLIGSPATHRGIASGIAIRSSRDVCVIDYRLAPEHPFPAARDDAVAAYRDLLTRGYEPADIVLAGDSAGGHLALITALELAAQGQPMPGALVCFSPVVDFTAEDMHTPPLTCSVHRAWIVVIPVCHRSMANSRNCHACSYRSARTNSCSMTVYDSPPEHAKPESRSSSSATPNAGTCFKPIPGY